MDARSGRPNGARVIHHGADELLIQQDSAPDGEITHPIQEGTQHTQSLSSFLSKLIDVRRPSESFIEDYTQITSSFDPLDSFPEEDLWSALNVALLGTREDYRGALRDIYGDFSFAQPPLKGVDVLLQVAE